MIAVLLAAGMGIRFRPFTETIPKGLIEIGGKTLLARSLETLSANGIEEAVVVVGHLGEMIRSALGPRIDKIEIAYVENPFYSTTGSMYSFSLAREFLHGDALVLDGDILYEPLAVKRAIASKYENCTVIADPSGSGDEVYVCADRQGRLNGLGKQIPDGRAVRGEFIGVTRVSKPFLDRMFGKADEEYGKGNRNLFFEDVLFQTGIQYDDSPVHALCLPGLTWIEIDRESDYLRALQVVYPRFENR